jgi:hypothetical protein
VKADDKLEELPKKELPITKEDDELRKKRADKKTHLTSSEPS